MIRFPRVLGAVGAVAFVTACDLAPTEPRPPEPMTLVGGDETGSVYAVDEGTGSVTLLRTAAWASGFGVYFLGPIRSMSWIPSVDEWWIATGRGETNPCPNCIFRFDPAEEVVFPVMRDVGLVHVFADFAVHPVNERVYTFLGQASGYLLRIDPMRGGFYEVKRNLDEGTYGKGATFTADGLLYVVGDDKLTRIDLRPRDALEAVTLVGSVTFEGFPTFANYAVEIASLATRDDGTMIALVLDGGAVAGIITATYLAAIDPRTAVVTNMTATTTLLTSIAYVPARLLN